MSSICSICMTDIQDQASTTLHCGHQYHTHCYSTYLAHNLLNKKENISCPMCRNPIIKVTIHSSSSVDILTYTNDVDDEDDIGQNEDNTERHTFSLMHNEHNSTTLYYEDLEQMSNHNYIYIVLCKVVLIICMLYMSFLMIQCGVGKNNILCETK
jgi:hypothetical protein